MAPRFFQVTSTLYERTIQQRLQNYESALQEGTYRPFIYPWDTLPALWLILALLIFPRLPPSIARVVRLPTFLLIVGHCIYVGRSCRTIGLAGGYGIGLSAMWGCIMSMALLLTSDLKNDFTRLEVRPIKDDAGSSIQLNGNATATSTSTSKDTSDANLRRRKEIFARPPTTQTIQQNSSTSYTVTWQTYPFTLIDSLDWILDLVTAFRGVNWNFRNPTLPPLSTSITHQTHSTSTHQLKQIQLSALRSTITYYVLTDTFKSLMTQDPYFLGLAPLSSPSPYSLLQPHPILTRFLRLLLAVLSTNIILSLIFTLSPLLFPLLPQFLTRTPLHNPDMYPDYFQPLFRTISRSGLSGFWGRSWHQLFRFGISQPGLFVCRKFDIPLKSQLGRAVQLFIAFTLSGLIHASASYTSFPPDDNSSRPVSGPLAFFVSQAVGIMVQTYLTQSVSKEVREKIPLMVRKGGNVLFVATWLFITGPLLADDFARCGVWLFEPLPVSFIRGLKGEGWWFWGGRWAGLISEGRWWEKGIALY